MAYLKDKTLKQIGTNIVNDSNVPNVPPHLQTANYYPQGTTNTPPPMGNAFVAGPQGPQIYNNQMGMSNQMGTYPTLQTTELDDKKKIHLGHDWDARSQSTTDVFIKGARVKDGVTTEKGKKVRYHRSPDMGTPENPKSHLGDHDPIYTKEIYKKKKGAEAGFETWEKKGEKQISKKKFDRQIKRKSKRYGDIIAHVS